MSDKIWYLYFFIIVIAEVLAIWLLTEWSKKDETYIIILGIISYIIVAIFFALLMRTIKGDKLAIVNAIWQVFGLIAVTILGIWLFKEKLLLYEWIGVALAIVALILLCVGEVVKD